MKTLNEIKLEELKNNFYNTNDESLQDSIIDEMSEFMTETEIMEFVNNYFFED